MNKAGQDFLVDQEELLVSRIVKFSSRVFGMDSNDVNRVPFTFAELNFTKYNNPVS
jgi:hypothetical protein